MAAPGRAGALAYLPCVQWLSVGHRAESGSAVVSRVDLVKQGCDRLGQMSVAGSRCQQAGERFGAKFAAMCGEAAQIVRSLRDAKTESDCQRLHVPCDGRGDWS